MARITLEQAAAAFCGATDADASNKAAAQLLKVLSEGSAKSKDANENTIVLKSLKHAQHRFGEKGHDADILLTMSEVLLQRADSDSSTASRNQVAVLRYTFVRKLVSNKQFGQALQQALTLYQKLESPQRGAQKKGRKAAAQTAPPPAPEAINLAVGTTLTLAVCWAEAPDEHTEHLSIVLESATNLHLWTSFLDPSEALKHSESLSKYLYRGALRLVQLQQWQDARATCVAMVATCPLVPALEAVCKILPHLPEVDSIHLAAACMPIDRVASLAAAAAAFSDADTKALLAVLQLGTLLRKSVQPLLSSLERSSNALTTYLGALDQVVGIASSLESLAQCAVVAGVVPSVQPPQLAKFIHSAVIAAVLGIRIRSCCIQTGELKEEEGIAPGCDAVHRLLGWEFPDWQRGAEDLDMPEQELVWLSSAVFNVAVQLLEADCCIAAIELLKASIAASISAAVAESAACQEVFVARAEDIAKKAAALAEALFKVDQPQQALESLASAIGVLQASGLASNEALLPIVDVFVRMRFRLVTATSTTQKAAAAAATKPTRGRKKSASQPSSQVPHLYELIPTSQAVWAVHSAELQAWSLLAAEHGAPAGDEASLVVQHLLQAHPAAAAPIRHAQVLMAAYSVDISACGLDGVDLLRTASTVLQSIAGSDFEAACLRSQVATLQALSLAQQGVHSKLDERKQCEQRQREWRQKHPDRAGESGGTAPGGFDPVVDARQWQEAREAAQAAVSCCTGLVKLAGKNACHVAAQDSSLLKSVIKDLLELVALVSMQGYASLEAELVQTIHRLTHVFGLDNNEAGAAQLPHLHSSSLAAIIFGIGIEHQDNRTMKMDVETLTKEASSAASGSSRAPATALKRAELWATLSRRHVAAGDLVPAVYAASEAHRLVSSSCSEGEDVGGSAWWQLAACRLKALLRLGQLFECTGLAEEAAQVLHEGQCLASIVGSAPLAALFAARLADVRCAQGRKGQCQQALDSAQVCLAAYTEAGKAADPVVIETCSAEAAAADARLKLETGDIAAAAQACALAVGTCQDAMAALDALQQDASSCPCEISNTACGVGQGLQSAGAAALTATHAEALLTRAHCLKAEGDVAEARSAASEALDLLEEAGGGDTGGQRCARLQACRVRLHLFLAIDLEQQQQESCEAAGPRQPATIWGLQSQKSELTPACSSSSSNVLAETSVNKGLDCQSRGGKAAGRKPKSMPAAAAAAAAGSSQGTDGCEMVERRCWLAYLLSKDIPHLNRLASARLAKVCGFKGYLYLAAVLLHCSQGATLRVQYQLVQYTKAQQLQASSIGALQQEMDTTRCIRDGFDRDLMATLAGLPSSALAEKSSSKNIDTSSTAAAYAALNIEAKSTLTQWMSHLPPDTAVCTLSVGHTDNTVFLSRIRSTGNGSGCVPLLVELQAPVLETGCSFSRHPIRALSMDMGDEGANKADNQGEGVSSVLQEMRAVLEDSTHSMRVMETETKEQQRAWWQARVELDDRLERLLCHMEGGWMGAWKCLLLGSPEQGESVVDQAMQLMLGTDMIVGGTGNTDNADDVSVAVAKELMLVALYSVHVLTPAQLHQVVTAACAAGTGEVEPSHTIVSAVLEALASKQEAEGLQAVAGGGGLGTQGQSKKGVARAVTFLDASEVTSIAEEEGGLESSATTRFSGTAGDLCGAFGTLAIQENPAAAAAAVPVAPATGSRQTSLAPPSTARVKKHKSRLAMMHTPGPKSARKPPTSTIWQDPVPMTVLRLPATAPRQRRLMDTPGAPQTMPAAARAARRAGTTDTEFSGGGVKRGAVVLVLDSLLQALPWESLPCLKTQRVYRVPSLPCAVAASQRQTPCSVGVGSTHTVDLSSTYYTINPSGDLVETQGTFQDWFEKIQGWKGVSGSAPSAPELAHALKSHDFFVYFGHGGGEQYIPAGRLRALPRCATSLLMGCSSGKLQDLGQIYEPTGVVLAYLLAGCPTVVANLWDVTDKDIDRFSQAVLTLWLSAAGQGGDVSAGVHQSRSACKLQHLIGAAPVCYGLPTSVRFSKMQAA